MPSGILFLGDPYWLVIADTFLATNLSASTFNKTLDSEIINAFALNKCGQIFLAIVSA